MLLTVAMIVVSTGMKAHASASLSSQTTQQVRVNREDPQINGTAADCPFKIAGQNNSAHDTVVSINNSTASQELNASMRGVSR